MLKLERIQEIEVNIVRHGVMGRPGREETLVICRMARAEHTIAKLLQLLEAPAGDPAARLAQIADILKNRHHHG